MKRACAIALLLAASPALAQAPKAAVPPAVQAAMTAKDRSTDALLRDGQRHVVEILTAADAKPGQRALDVGSGSGYLALLLSSMVGETGHVDIQNTANWINQFPGMDPNALKRRIKRDNIGYITANWDAIPIVRDSYDVITAGEVWHDVVLEGADYAYAAKSLYEMLKPGGRLVIEDHDANPEMDIRTQVNLHRISHGDVEGQFIKAGFKLEQMQLFDSTYDNLKMNVFFPGVRGRTDKFVATFVKPRG